MSTDFPQVFQDHSYGKQQPFQQMVLGQRTSHEQKNQIECLPQSILKIIIQKASKT